MAPDKRQDDHCPKLTAGQQVSAIDKALAFPDLSPAARLVAVVLCRYANQNSVCFPSQQLIAKQLAMSDRGVRRAIAELAEKGAIKVATRWKRNTYRLEFWRYERDYPVDNLVDRAGETVSHRTDLSYDHRTDLSYDKRREDNSKTKTDSETACGLVDNMHTAAEALARAPRTFLSHSWQPSAAGISFARELGMTVGQLETELAKFRIWNDDRRISSVDWNGVWLRWCRSWSRHAMQRGQKQREAPLGSPGHDRHHCMSIADFCRRYGFTDHVRAVAIMEGVQEPEKAWSAFVLKHTSRNVTLSQWPTVFREYCKDQVKKDA